MNSRIMSQPIMYKSLILDRDGVINEIIMRGKVVSSPWNIEEFKFLDDNCNVIKILQSLNIEISIASNQPDISRGNLTNAELLKMNKKITSELHINDIYVCRHDNYHNCNCRKPKPGMLSKIIQKSNYPKEKILMVGDSFKDAAAADAAMIDMFFFKTKYNSNSIPKSAKYISSNFDDLRGLF